MSVPWYEWKNIKNRLITFGRAIQGTTPYRVTIEPDKSRCATGYCNFTNQEIAVNPSIFNLPPRKQYRLTKAILVHESGHKRFTMPVKLSPVVGIVANILEDERVERAMCSEFAGLVNLVRELSYQLYTESKPVDTSSGCPGEVVSYFLQLRWANRLGQPVKGGLSPLNMQRWEKIKHLVSEAWESETSKVVNRNAEEIVHILGLKDVQIPVWVINILGKLGEQKGERGADDPVEKSRILKMDSDCEESEGDTQPFDGEVPPNDSEAGKGSETIEPAPYLWLEQKVRGLVQELIEELAIENAENDWGSVERGGKLVLREYLRDHTRPFISQEMESRKPPTMAVKIIVDHSTSLNRISKDVTRIASIAESVMMLHLVFCEMNIPHEIIATPQQIMIADNNSGERGKALVAGLIPAKCGYENMGLALKANAIPMAAFQENFKLVLCLTDGACNDAKLGKDICRLLRGKVEITGVLLDPDEKTKGYVTEMFGQDRVIACGSEQIPNKLSSIIRAIRGI
jgi:hypothetical protein